jgi:hypothetical protein
LALEESGVGRFLEDFGKHQAGDFENSGQPLACGTFDR